MSNVHDAEIESDEDENEVGEVEGQTEGQTEGQAEGDVVEDAVGEGGLDEDEGVEEEVDSTPEKSSRGKTRFQKLSQTARESTERAAAAERRAQELEAQLARFKQPDVQEKEPSADEMALWSTDQIVDYKLGKATGKFEQTIAQMQFRAAESSDKAGFQALCARDPVAAKYADEVETRLADLRSKGQNVDRERLLTYLVGEKVRQGSQGARKKAAAEGQRRIKRETVVPGSSRGDTETPRRGGKSLEDRLADVKF